MAMLAPRRTEGQPAAAALDQLVHPRRKQTYTTTTMTTEDTRETASLGTRMNTSEEWGMGGRWGGAMDIFHWDMRRRVGNRRFIRLGFWEHKSEREKHFIPKAPE